ncbi:MAG: inositol monophosphatase [Rhodospirillales bacterium]|nr:inositol monophosphatase [Rhodospirillales bacterium]
MKINFEKVTALMKEAAETEILPRFKQLKDHEISEKAPGDIVTAADIEAEIFLTKTLCDLMPSSLALGEEAVSKGTASLDILNEQAPVWVIDPVDGTQNFSKGKDTFAVMVSLCRQGEILAGWILDPLSGRIATAEQGGGAWLEGERIKSAPDTEIEEMTGPLWGRMIKQLEKQVKQGWGQMPKHVPHYGCVAHEYIDLAKGTLHFSLYGRLKPWDHAAGILLHKEAGGFSGLCKGKKPYQAFEIEGERLLIAPSEKSWERLNTLFKGK